MKRSDRSFLPATDKTCLRAYWRVLCWSFPILIFETSSRETVFGLFAIERNWRLFIQLRISSSVFSASLTRALRSVWNMTMKFRSEFQTLKAAHKIWQWNFLLKSDPKTGTCNLNPEPEIWLWKLTMKFEPVIWLWTLDSEIWTWNLIMKFEPENWPWNLNLKFDSEIWTWNWNLQFNPEIWLWNLNLNIGSEIWTSNLILKSELEIWLQNWPSNYKYITYLYCIHSANFFQSGGESGSVNSIKVKNKRLLSQLPQCGHIRIITDAYDRPYQRANIFFRFFTFFRFLRLNARDQKFGARPVNSVNFV